MFKVMRLAYARPYYPEERFYLFSPESSMVNFNLNPPQLNAAIPTAGQTYRHTDKQTDIRNNLWWSGPLRYTSIISGGLVHYVIPV